MQYKRTGGNTTNLHKHLQRKHPSKIGAEVESGEMDKYVKKDLLVNFILFYINIFLHFMLFT